MITRLQKSFMLRGIAMLLSLSLFFEIFYPTAAYALTGGPSQPEVQSFEPIGTSEMVDLFSGDFTYNIPLMDVGGYPLNISYGSGIGMDQEASWVGLGWNLNPGAITRNMRGLADDFSGDEVVQEQNMKPNNTYGITGGVGAEFFGWDALSVNYSLGINYNTYNGIGFEQTLAPTFSMGQGGQESMTANLGFALNANSSEGPSISPSLSFSDKMKTKNKDEVLSSSLKVGVAVSSRGGLKSLSIGVSGSLGPASSGENKKNPGLKDLKKSLKDPDDKDKVSFGNDPMRGFNGGASIDIGGSTYVPVVDMSRINTNFSFSAKFGGTFFGADATYNLGGYFSSSKLISNTRRLGAYGYLYSQFASEKSMHDFNREKDGAFTKNSYNLPLTNYTYDVFTIAGQGIGGMFRPFRSELGHVHDPLTRSYSASGSLGAELSPGNLVHVGIDLSVNGTESHSGDWVNDNFAWSRTNFRQQAADSDFEPVYFKEAGEKSVDDDSYFDDLGGTEPYRVELSKSLGNHLVLAKANLINKAGTQKSLGGGGLRRSQRVKRNQSISYLRADEAMLYGTFKYVSPYSKPHHIAEIDVVRKDGARYIYGIAAYNFVQKEASFNTQGLPASCETGLVSYGSTDASSLNSRGIDNYYSKTTTPPYAHSYLLTSVFSPDYSDVDGVTGPSPGDLGSYTKFDYDANTTVNGIQAYDANYHWRTPYSRNGGEANFNEGLKSDANDNKGSYVYGEKEMWYLEKIETKTYVAVFHKSSRSDSHGVTFESGVYNSTDALPKLDSISLYSLPDYLANGNSAEPIKRVHFEYDYTLCKNTGNNTTASGAGSGKLTLKKIYFTYGKSFKGRLNAYEFEYADADHDGNEDANPDYDIRGYDRWGNYKPNSGSCDATTSGLTPPEYPYVQYDDADYASTKADADIYAASWTLTKIKLPSGGEIKVTYESDDYAYVQDKEAMQMFKITASGKTSSDDPTAASGSHYLYGNGDDFDDPDGVRDYLFFKRIDGTIGIDEYIKDLVGKKVYFRFLTNLVNSSPATSSDYVSGYFDILEAGVSGANSDYGYIKVQMVDEGDGSTLDTHPVSKAAWQFGRKYNPRLVYNLPDPAGSLSVEGVLNTIANASLIGGVFELFSGANHKLHKDFFASTFTKDKSWIRLYNPNGKKLGGGSRVKRIEIDDKWSVMETESASSDFAYGQSYTYELEDGRSSGVAANEPQLGGDENVLKQPIFIDAKILLAPDDGNYIETPFGESFYPGASVGYSRVKVKSLAQEKAVDDAGTLTRHATGHVIHEFYTAKDFPVLTDRTDLDKARKAPSPIGQILKLSVKDYMTASQGFAVELNDMHGKPKAQWVYAEGQTTPISGVEYKYQTSTVTQTFAPFGASVSKTVLDNEVVVIEPDGNVVDNVEVGVDFDVVNDYREAKTYTFSAGGNGNLAVFLAAIIPVPVPTIFPQFGNQTTRFRSASTTKVINRYGILKETIAYDMGSKVSTENLAYDAQTGEVLLTKTKNNYDDYVYNFTYPAHWGYDRMGQAYKNIGYICTTTTTNTGSGPTLATAFDFGGSPSKLVKGDEVIVYDISGSYLTLQGKAWVWDTDEDNTNGQYLIKDDGTAFFASGTYGVLLKVLRSGRRNMQALPIGSVVSMINPIDTDNNGVVNDINTGTPFASVIDANATEFSENWGTFCNPKAAYQEACTICEAYAQAFNEVVYNLNDVLANGAFCQTGYTITPGGFTATYPSGWNYSSGCTGNTTFVGYFGLGHTASCPLTFYAINSSGVAVNLPVGFEWGDLVSLNNYEVSPKDESGVCITDDSFYLIATGMFNNGTSIQFVQVLIELSSSCGSPVGNCEIDECAAISGSIINPYVLNVRGNWRMKKTHLHLEDRDQLTASSGGYTNINTRKSGKYSSFTPFWDAPSSSTTWDPNTTNWTWTSEVSKYSPYGFEIENKDALERYSGAVFGYNHTLAKAVASNARYNEIAFDGFEDYDLMFNTDCCPDHFAFEAFKADIVNTRAHTGKHSIKLEDGDVISVTYDLTDTIPSGDPDDVPYTVKSEDLLGHFGPVKGNPNDKEYILSFWTRAECTSCLSGFYDFSFDDMDPVVKIDGTPVTFTSTQQTEVIDGWQRYEYRFTVPSGSTTDIYVEFTNSHASDNYYLDDIRIQPFNSSMKAFVYDPITYRLMAELDERNFATFYEYDESGALLRIKKETEKGIMTIQESRNNSFKKIPE